ncbi:MAG: FHA domain-containing protein [Alphaproteobacteria bacterium]|nr:FHA domain-containing protein [Alphaproteobacteria bacterium]
MGLLISNRSGDFQPLSARTVVGRGPLCNLRLSDPRVSGEHASLSWRDGRWLVRDLGSRNGTWVEGKRLGAGSQQDLRPNDQLAFGDPTATWTLSDAGPPAARALCPSRGLQLTEEGGVLLLPDAEDPEWSISQQGQGWLAEGLQELRPVRDGEVLSAGGALWRLLLPIPVEATQQAGQRAASLRFRVSPDEEYVEIELLHGDAVHPVRSQSFSYLLLTLGRRSLEDAALPPEQRGWVHAEGLSTMLRLPVNTINVYVYRARRAFGRLAPELGPGLIERRARTGQLRLTLPVEAIEPLG